MSSVNRPAMSIQDDDVQDFLKQNVQFLEDLQRQRVKLPENLKIDREELLRISTDWICTFPEPEPEPGEETYDDDVGIYGEIGESDDEDMPVGGEVQGEGAKILNLHASYKGWMKVDGFFNTSRWWCLIYSKGGTNFVFSSMTSLEGKQFISYAHIHFCLTLS